MGQYFKAINIETMAWMQSNGFLKLTETSWIGNDFMQALMVAMSPGRCWHNTPIVMCGDYYDEKGEADYYDKVEAKNKIEYSSKEISEEEHNKVLVWQFSSVLVNHSKKEYVDFRVLPKSPDGYTINPLPILVALGNNRGGGDYRDWNPDFHKVGIWAMDRLSIENEIPYGYWELKVAFQDN